jgi:hypothetical protein
MRRFVEADAVIAVGIVDVVDNNRARRQPLALAQVASETYNGAPTIFRNLDATA